MLNFLLTCRRKRTFSPQSIYVHCKRLKKSKNKHFHSGTNANSSAWLFWIMKALIICPASFLSLFKTHSAPRPTSIVQAPLCTVLFWTLVFILTWPNHPGSHHLSFKRHPRWHYLRKAEEAKRAQLTQLLPTPGNLTIFFTLYASWISKAGAGGRVWECKN